jgi:DNA-directed RNA polymerase subunit M/transcription elongation factor TFIIS
MSIPLIRACPECEGEMELLTADEAGEIVVYECPECGYQIELPVETEADQTDDPQEADRSGADTEEDDLGEEPPEPEAEA